MKKILIIAPICSITIILFACTKTPRKTTFKTKDTSCGTVDGNVLHKDSQHNCYYLNESGQKEYVENSVCSCL
ncbi:MAG: hypothetical protein H0W73_15410 [Bacteroidetes bacterium]|nr:hypothetical protein [Bacteroidota bacterium]